MHKLEAAGSTKPEAVGARDMHLVRIHREDMHTLVINNVGGQMGKSIVEYHKAGDVVTLDAKSRPGYTFEFWQSGIDTENCSEGGSDVAFIENGDYIGFHGMNFGRGAASVDFRVGANSSGGAIEVRLGAPDGKLIGSMEVSGTGGWQTWKTQRCTIEPTIGVNDVYFVFRSGEGYLFNINWFRINCPYENDDLLGDCNLDGAVTIADAIMLQKWLITETDVLTSWRHADMNQDSRVNAADLTLL